MTTGRIQESGHFGLVMIEFANRRLAGGYDTHCYHDCSSIPLLSSSNMATQKANKYVSAAIVFSNSFLTFPKLVIRPPKGIRNKAPRGRAADQTGLAI
jgi:hypothetical protein